MATYIKETAFSPQAGVVTQRPSSTALLLIDSEDRFKNYTQERLTLGISSGTGYNQSPYDFTIVKNESIMNGFFTRLGLTEVSFPWTIPNINRKTQQIIVNWSNASTNASGSSVVNMAQPDFLKPSGIATQLQVQIRAANPDLAAFALLYGVQDPNEPKFFYTSGVSGLSNVYVSFSPLPYNSTLYPYPDTTKQLFDLLGFTAANSAIPPIATGGRGKTTLCQATRYVDIVCPQLVYNQPLKDTMTQQIARDSLCRLYLADGNNFGNNTLSAGDSNFCPPGCAPFTIYRQFQTPKMINWTPNQPVAGVLTFQVYDDTGANLSEMCSSAVVPLGGFGVNPDYTDWSATVLVSEN